MVRLGFALSVSFSLAGCVGYVADDSDAASVAAGLRHRVGGAFSWTTAAVTALQQNPELRALEAEARAAGAVTQPLDVESEYRTETEMLAALLDPIAMLGLGVRGAAADFTEATARAATERLAVARWRTSAAVVEAFVLEARLAAIPTVTLDVDAAAFARAGLASPVAIAQLRAAASRLAAEAAMVAAERAGNRARVRGLLGLPSTALFEFVDPEAAVIAQPTLTETALLARPDLGLAAAEFHVADAEFRRAVADQYPSVRVGPEFPIRGGPLEAMAVLRLPFGMAGVAAAARDRRDAARERLTTAWLQADTEAAAAGHQLAAARANDDAATAGLAASLQAFAIAKVALEVDDDAFDRAVEAATMVARDAMERRTASVAHVRAEVARAVACGWPAARGTS